MPPKQNVPSHPFITPFLFQTVQAYVWIEAGWEKLHGGTFVSGISKTLEAFAGKNPHSWYVDTMLRAAQQQPELFGNLVKWGEVLTGVGLVTSIGLYLLVKGRGPHIVAAIIAILSLIAGAFMSVNFYFAAGWMNPSTSTLTMYLFWTSIIILGGWTTALVRLTRPRT